MRIVRLDEFMALPSGTLFHKYTRCVTEPMHIKFESLGSRDWVELGFTGYPEATSSSQEVDFLLEMENDGVSHPLDLEGTCRHGLYPDDGLFMVYERADVEALIAYLKEWALPEQEIEDEH